MELGETLELTLDERNGKLLNFENDIINNPEFQEGDKVKPSALGMQTGLFQAGELFIIVKMGELIGKWAGDPSRTIELWNFNGQGVLNRTVTDPKFIELVERKGKKKPSKK